MPPPSQPLLSSLKRRKKEINIDDERKASLFIRLFRSWREQCTCDIDISGILTLSWRTIEIGIRLTAACGFMMN